MRYCTSCGHELGAGRFCTNCGHPAATAPAATPAVVTDQAWRTDTAERERVPAAPSGPPPSGPPPSGRPPFGPPPSAPPPSAPPPPTPPVGSPAPPPPAPAPSSGPRFPLFADELTDDVDRPRDPSATAVIPAVPAAQPTHHRRRSPVLPWLAAIVVLALVVLLGFWLVTGTGGDDTAKDPAGTRSAPGHSGGSSPDDGSKGTEPDAQPGDLADQAHAAVPATAPPNEDVDGKRVTYGADNLFDGIPETCWRMPGDGSGQEITIKLRKDTEVRRVGLINGYAKSASDARGRELDWYHGNRRVLSVDWVFDDGTTISQDLDDTTAVQSIDVDDVTTSTITLRMVSVSPPGKGRAARDYTAISEISLLGAAG